jgi:transposase
MPKRITIKAHLTIEELEARYRASKDAVERSHHQIIWLLAQGRPSEEVASITGYSRSWIYELVWGYNRVGPDSLGDKRHEHPGAEPLLNPEQRAALKEVISKPPEGGGRWSGAKVGKWMTDLLGREVTRQRGWEYLKLVRYGKESKEEVEEKPKKRSHRSTGRDRPRRIKAEDVAVSN